MLLRTQGRWVCALVLGLAGCSAGVEGNSYGDESVASDAEALDQGCGSLTPVQSFTGTISYTTPLSSYSQTNCYKGQVLQYSLPNPSAGVGTVCPLGPGACVMVEWADTPLNTRAACEDAWLASYLFEASSASGPFTTIDIKQSHGVFGGGEFPTCFLSIAFFGLNSSKHYKFAASARTQQTTGAPTRKFRIRN